MKTDLTAVNDEAHFWLNGYVNKQNCRIWSEANPQVYVKTPLHPEKLTGALYGLVESFKNDEGHNVTVNGDRYRAMITNFFIPELNNHDVQELCVVFPPFTRRRTVLPSDSSNDEFGKITLSSAFGENVEAKLIKTAIALDNNSLNHPMDCLVAITDKLNADALIPPALYESLCSINDKNNKKENEIFAESADSSIEELKLNKGNFLLLDGLIYHRDKILNEPVMQLVLPRCRIDKVMKLAHESVFGGHMGVKKTKERIKYNFFWPNMSGEIAEFVQTCKGCQLRKTEKIGDRAPITPIVHPELPFEIVNIDVIGPIQPPSGRGHKYVLCMMDQHTRWPEAVPLRSLTAKNACDSLLQIFSRTGIPSIIASDQGTNFKSALTQEFTKRDWI
ncbi:hypothetical protein TNCV_932672 [Trichonephila clavipes]|nr:hypothetical protein TNCV_932672 [Trichonephila clavipes]